MKTTLVYLVGAGPGDAGLITFQAMRMIRRADCIIYDGLVNETLLDLACSTAEKISVAKSSGKHAFTQAEINKLIVRKAEQGLTVVRLKGGDPTIFGRAGEEIDALRKAKIAFEIVPGITAGIAAAAYCGIMLTDRDYSSQVMLMTGHPAEGRDFTSLDWDSAAKFGGSVVLYMAVNTLSKVADILIKKGKASDTPAAVIQNATLPSQKIVRGTLHDIAARCKTENIAPPAIVIVGKAAGAKAYNWFMNRPLFGRKVLVTRDKEGNSNLSRQLTELGAGVVSFEGIGICGPRKNHTAIGALKSLDHYDWVVFTSSHGVRFTMQLLWEIGLDSRAFGKTKIACIGAMTADALGEYGLRADFVPDLFTSKSLAGQLGKKYPVEGKKILLLRSAIAPDELVRDLEQQKAVCQDIKIYNVVKSPIAKSDIKKMISMIQQKRIDWITFTSSSTVESFFERIPAAIIKKAKVKIASIGPETTKKLHQLGISAALEAKRHTADGIVDAIRKYRND